MPLYRKQQITARIEQGYGAASSMNALHAKFQVIAPTFVYEPEFYQRTIIRGTLTSDPGQIGAKPARARFGLEMSGHADGVSAPTWGLLLKACGFRQVVMWRATIGAIVGGPLRHGETITDASGDTATVIRNTYDGETTLRFCDARSTAGASIDPLTITGAITGGTTGATATISGTNVNAGFAWYPISTDQVFLDYSATGVLTGTISVGTIVRGNTSGAVGIVTRHDLVNKTLRIRTFSGTFAPALTAETISSTVLPGSNNITNCVSDLNLFAEDIPTLSIGGRFDGLVKLGKGARGSVSFSGKVGEPMIMQFEFLGNFSSQADSAPLAGVVYIDKVPPLMLGVANTWGLETDTVLTLDYLARASAWTLDMQNTLSILRDFNQSSGINFTHISARNPVGGLDPELDLEASFPYTTSHLAGTILRSNLRVGSSLGNKFNFQMPGIQLTGEPFADSDGILRRQIGYRCTGGFMTNATNSAGSDNEVVITLDNA